MHIYTYTSLVYSMLCEAFWCTLWIALSLGTKTPTERFSCDSNCCQSTYIAEDCCFKQFWKGHDHLVLFELITMRIDNLG
jgi:hypothetical protein